MNNKFNYIFNFTLSKTIAVIILIIGSVFSFVFGSGEVLISTFGITGGLLGLKSWNEAIIRKTRLNHGLPEYYNYSQTQPENMENPDKPTGEIG